MSSVVGISTHSTVDAAAERAFVEEHGARLRGFALLLALGDARAAGAAARSALNVGAERAGRSEMPGIPDDWLRQRVLGAIHPPLRQLQRIFNRDEPVGQDQRNALRDLGVSDVALGGLVALSPVERAAVVAVGVEGLDRNRLASVLNLGPAASQRVLERGFRHYFAAANAILQEKPWARREQPGEIAKLVSAAADAGNAANTTAVLDEQALHRRFREWLIGSRGDLPEKAAAHTAECTGCANAVVALDALRAVDTTRPVSVALPPERPAEEGLSWMLARYLAPPAVVVAVALMQVAAGESGLVPAPGALFDSTATPSSAPQAIGGQSEGATSAPSTEPGESPPTIGPVSSDGTTPGVAPPEGTEGGIAGIPPEGVPTDPDATFGPGASDPAIPPPGVPPPPSTPPGSAPPSQDPTAPPPPPPSTDPPPPSQDPTAPPPPPPPPTADPTAPPPPPPPPPTPDPTPPPPTPDPTPIGILPECADGDDNDNDGFVDLLDLGCLNSLDLTED